MMMKLNELIEEIRNPGKEYTPIPFWFFNDEPDEEKITAQLKDYVEKGVNGFVLHPRIGVPKTLPYLSEEYFDWMLFIVKTAASFDMKVVLYDEGMYPSGSAHGMVVAANPEYASKGIILADGPCDGEILYTYEDGKSLVYRYTRGTIRGIHFGEDDGEENAPLSADILNPDAVSMFIKLTHDKYYEKLKEYFGNTIIAFFTDEPSALGRNAWEYREWIPGLEKEIIEAGGNIAELRGLFTKEHNKTIEIYEKLIKKYLRENFYAPLSKWCTEHGISLTGHPERSDDVEEQLYFQIPGQDLIMRRIVPKTGGLIGSDSVQAKLAADIARHLGRRRNANECFGVCYRDGIPWYFTAEDMKWYIDWLGMRGVNLFVPHAFYYSVREQRSAERPPDVGPNNIWWKYYDRFSTYMKRFSYLMTDSVNCAKVAVICDNNRIPCEEVAALYEHQIEFNYLPVRMLDQCYVEENRLCIREYKYEVLFDPYGLLPEEFHQLNCSNIQVIHSTEKMLETAESEEKKELYTIRTNYDSPDLRVSHIMKHGKSMYLLSNEGEAPIDVQVILNEKGKVRMLDLWSGQEKKVKQKQTDKGIACSLFMEVCETVLFLVDKETVGEIVEDTAGESEVLSERVDISKAEDWTKKFQLVDKQKNFAIYEYIFDAEEVCGTESFTVQGEEMVECWCNDEFAGVSFWNLHQFQVGLFLKKGVNKICLRVTGSAANLYENANIEFGLM